MRKISCNEISYSTFNPYPGTEAFDMCKEKGLIGEDYDISLHNHQSPVSNFCENIPLERFRAIVWKVKKEIDRKNFTNRIKDLFTLKTFKKIQQVGIYGSFKKDLKIFIGKWTNQ
jgi:hypothetical protein